MGSHAWRQRRASFEGRVVLTQITRIALIYANVSCRCLQKICAHLRSQRNLRQKISNELSGFMTIAKA